VVDLVVAVDALVERAIEAIEAIEAIGHDPAVVAEIDSRQADPERRGRVQVVSSD